jgi:hypothetical protein
MGHRVINDIQVTVSGDNISDEELSTYLTSLQAKEKYKIVIADVVVDSTGVDVNYKLEYVPFERIRRITGYLVGSTARWCDSKRAEEHDRVKHG